MRHLLLWYYKLIVQTFLSSCLMHTQYSRQNWRELLLKSKRPFIYLEIGWLITRFVNNCNFFQIAGSYKRPTLIYLNTFQLDLYVRFHPPAVTRTANEILDEYFTDHKYNPQVCRSYTNLFYKLFQFSY